jgi:hypothetical protein
VAAASAVSGSDDDDDHSVVAPFVLRGHRGESESESEGGEVSGPK